MTTPLDSSTPISYKTGIFRQSEYTFCSFFAFLSRSPPYFHFRSAWPNFLKSGTRVNLAKWIPSTKFEADPTIPYRDMTPLPPIRYVTLWHWRLTFWPFDLLTLNGCRQFFVMRPNHPPTLSILRPIRSWVMMFTLIATGNIAYSQLRMRSITWSACKGLILTIFLKSVTPICLFTLQLLRRYDAD